jgi:tripartite-type tricarboxylate transporter receptor subunit TctC
MRVPRHAMIAISLVSIAATACAPSSADGAARYPTKAIELDVPFAAGGSTDIAARAIAKGLSDELGVPVNVVNKPGANQVTAVNALRSSAPNGYTLLADGAGSSSLQSLLRNIPYDWKDRTFVGRVASGPHVYVVGGKSPFKDLKAVIDEAKRDPSGFSVGWIGGTSTSDYATLQFLSTAGIDPATVKRVPFQGSGDVMKAVAAGDIDFGVGGASSAFSLAGTGNLRVLASTGDKALSQLKETPTTSSLGLADLNMQYWVGLSAPKGLPATVVSRLENAINKISTNAQVVKQLSAIGMVPDAQSSEQTAGSVDTEAKNFAELAKKLGTGK